MTAALELYLDPAAERRIRTLWDAFEDAGVPSLRDLTHRKHRPHLSLFAAPALDGPAVAAALAGLAVAPSLPIRLDHLGIFPGRVMWLGPPPSRVLLAHHEAVAARLAVAGIEVDPFYRPGFWVPHMTVSMRVPLTQINDAVKLCMDVLPLEVTITGAAVADHAGDLYHPL